MASEWYVLRSKPHKEQALCSIAQRWALDVYYPHIRVEPVNPRSSRVRPYFPGYLFARADLEETGRSVFRHMPMSMGLVEFGGQPASLTSSLVEEIRSHLKAMKQGNLPVRHSFVRGNKVVIAGGVFEGYEALFDATLPGSDRVRVLLAVLGGQRVKVTLPAAHIEPTP